MAGIKDFLFGSGPLKKAAGSDVPSGAPSQPAGLDMAKLAQDAADRAKQPTPPAKPTPTAGKSPLSTTMTPQQKAGK